MAISVIIPVFNESEAIANTVNQVFEILSENKIEFELIIVNDGSTDGSFQKVQEIFDSFPDSNLKIIHHQHNLGYGAAIKSGILNANKEVIGILDADDTYEVSDLLKLLNHLAHFRFDMVVGQRQGRSFKGSLSKQFLRALLKRLVEFMTGRKVPDINSGSRVFRKDLALQNLDLLSDKFSFTTSITLAFMMRNAFVDYVPISYHKRTGNSKVKIVQDSIRTFGFVLTVSLYFNPLRIFAPLSGIFFVLGLLNLIVSLLFINQVFVLMATVFVSTSAIIFAMGLVAQLFGDKALSINGKR